MPYPDNHFEPRKPKTTHPGARHQETPWRPDLGEGSVMVPYIEVRRVDLSKGNRVVHLFQVPENAMILSYGYRVEEETDVSGNVIELLNAFDSVQATGSVTFSDLPSANDTVTIGDIEYTFVESLTAANDVKIGATTTETAINLAAAIKGAKNSGSLYGSLTLANDKVTASSSSNVVNLVAIPYGADGDDVTLSKSGTNITIAGMTGGDDGTSMIGAFAADTEGKVAWSGALSGAQADDVVDIVETNPYRLTAKVSNATAPTEGIVQFFVQLINPAAMDGAGLLV